MADKLNIVIEGENKTGNAFAGAEKNMNDLQGAAGNLHNKVLGPLNNMMGTVLKASTAALAAGLAGLTAVIGSSVKGAMAMEQQLADISASMGTSAEETGKLKKLIGDLGFDPKLKVSATEAADAIQTLGTAGLTVDEIMDGAARSTVLLANATGADFADAAAIATDVMAQFNIKAEDMQDAVNQISGVTLASKFDINDYKLAISQAGGVASMAGISFEDFNAVIAATSPYFASGSDSGTSFKTMVQRLVPQSNEATDAMRALGLFTGLTKKEFDDAQAKVLEYQTKLAALDPTSKNYAERAAELNDKIGILRQSTVLGANAFFDANGSIKGMAEISNILNTATKDLSEEQKIQAFSTIFGSDAMRTAAAVANMTDAEFTQFKTTIAKTDAEELAATRMDTLSGVMEILWGVVEGLQLQIGDAFLPVLRTLAENFTQQAQIHGPRVVEMFRQFGEQLAAVIQYLIAVAIDGDRMNDWLTHMNPQVRDAVMATLSFVDSLKAVVANIISFIDWIGGLKTILTTLGVLMAVSVVAQVVGFVASIVSAVGAVVGFIGALGGTGAALAGVLAAIGPVVVIVGVVVAAVVGLYQAWQHNLFGIRDTTQQVFDWLKSVFAGLPAMISGAIESVKGFLFGWGRDAMGKLGEGVGSISDWLKTHLGQIVKDIFENGLGYAAGALFGRMYESARNFMLKFGEGLLASAPHLVGDIQAVLGGLVNAFNVIMDSFRNHVYGVAGSIGTRIKEGLASINLAGVMQGALGSLVTGFNTTMDAFRNHVYGVAADIGNRIKAGLASINLGDAMRGALWGIIDGFNSVMDSFRNHVWGVMSSIGEKISGGLAAGIRNGMQIVMDALNWITSVAPQWVRDALGIHSPSTVFADIGSNIMAGLAEGIAGATAMPEMALAGAAGGMVGATTNINRQDQRNISYTINNNGGAAQGDPIEQVRALHSAYGGAR